MKYKKLYEQNIIPYSKLAERYQAGSSLVTEEELEEAAMSYDPRMKLDVEFIRAAFKEGARWMESQVNRKVDNTYWTDGPVITQWRDQDLNINEKP